jgi:hypothetical protein
MRRYFFGCHPPSLVWVHFQRHGLICRNNGIFGDSLIDVERRFTLVGSRATQEPGTPARMRLSLKQMRYSLSPIMTFGTRSYERNLVDFSPHCWPRQPIAIKNGSHGHQQHSSVFVLLVVGVGDSCLDGSELPIGRIMETLHPVILRQPVRPLGPRECYCDIQ